MLKTYRVRHGLLAHFASDTTIGLSLARYGEWAEAEIYLLSQCVKPGDTVLDIGANVGTHSLALARMVGPEGRVIALEAQHNVFRLLTANMLINGLDRVDCLNVLVGASVAMDMIPVTDMNAPANFGAVTFTPAARALRGDAPKLPIATITVDSLGLARCDAMKVDVEGMELDVFQGAVQTIQRCRPLIHFEQTSARNLGPIVDLMTKLDYRLYWHVANPYNARNFKGDTENIFGGTCEVNIAAIPEARAELAARLGLSSAPLDKPIYNPTMPPNAVAGWMLPENAYGNLEPVPEYVSGG